MSSQWTDFLKGVVVGREYPDDPELREAAPETGRRLPRSVPGLLVVNSTTVNDLIKEALPLSLSLALAAFFMWITGGVLFGVIAAVRKGTISTAASWRSP